MIDKRNSSFRCNARKHFLVVAQLSLVQIYSSTSLAVIISPNVQPVESGYKGSISLLSDNDISIGDSSIGGVFGVISEGAEKVNDFWGNSEGQVSATVGAFNNRPYAIADANMFYAEDCFGFICRSIDASINSELAYGFSIEAKDPSALPVNQVPISVHIVGEVDTSVNGSARSSVRFASGGWDATISGFQNGYSLTGQEIWREDIVSPILAEGVLSFQKIKTSVIEVNAQYSFFLRARAYARQLQGVSVIASAYADPVVELDQAAFDEMMGDDTFPLDEYFTIGYSPGAEAFFVPEPSTVYLGVLTGTLLLLSRRRKASNSVPARFRQ